MFSAVRGLRRPAKMLLASIGLLAADLILIGVPGPCGIPGGLDQLFVGHREVEGWTAFVIVLVAISGIMVSVVWWGVSFVLRRTRTERE
jgi:hypothetical protein